MKALLHWIVRHAGAVAIVSVLLALVSIPFTVMLYRDLRTDLEELLPRTARSVRDLEKVTGRLQSSANLAVLAFSKHPRESRRFVTDLARALERRRSPLIARVEYRIDREMRYFSRRRALYIDVPDLVRVRDSLRDRIDYEHEIRNPLNIFSGVKIKEPWLDFRAIEGRYAKRAETFTRFPDGFYANREQTVRVILVYLSGKASGIGNALALRKLVDEEVARLDPRRYAPDLAVRYTGDVENLVEEHSSLIGDLELSGVIVSVFVVLAMLLFYRDLLATAALVTSLFIGTLITFGAAYFAVGYLNASTAFLGSIVIGNGINFGIIVLARYVEERRAARGMQTALGRAVQGTLTATLTAALAAGLSYGSLVLTGFRGFRQFGVIGLIGMVSCWATAFTTMPALLALIERARIPRRRGPARGRRRPRGLPSAWLASAVGRAPRLILAASVALVLAAAVATLRFHGDILEADMSRLRDRESMTRGSGFLSRHLDVIFGHYISPVVILASSRRRADGIARRVLEGKRREGDRSIVSGAYTLSDLVPARQREKIALLREIRSLLRPRIVRRMSASDRRLVDALLTPEAFRTFGVNDLPPAVLDRFRETDGSTGRLVLVEPVFDATILNDAFNQARFIGGLRAAADSVDPGAPVVGQLPLTVDMYQSVRHDGPRATAFALGAVVLLTILLFRRVSTVGLVLSALFLGVSWLALPIFGIPLKINFLNFIALPITFGIGVDYGVNIVQRYRLEGRGSILRVIRRTGGAVTLASLTTTIGYGSLLLAGNRGFVSFGRLAILGEAACVLAAVVSLPAWLHLRDERAARKTVEAVVEASAQGEDRSRAA